MNDVSANPTPAPPARRLRLAFMGSAAFSVPVLEALHAAGHDLVAVYTQPPRPAGRGHRPQSSPVQAFAERHGLVTRTPVSLRTAEAQADFAGLALDAAIVAAYGLILPRAILQAPHFGCLNVHASLLPRWRGAAPIQRAILAGDSETGITIMQMDEGLDTGPMLAMERVPIGCATTAAMLHDALALVGSRLLLPTLEAVAAGTARPQLQPADGATYAKKLERDEGRIDWALPAASLERMVRALNPQPGVFFAYAGERIKVLAATLAEGNAECPPGTLLDDRLVVACGTGALRLLRLQRAGRAAVDADAFLRGFRLAAGAPLTATEPG